MAAATALAVVLLGACGNEGDPGAAEPTSAEEAGTDTPSASESPSKSAKPKANESETAPPNTRECSEVWRAGARIPRIYPGCMEGEDFVEREGRACSSGQRLLHYRNFYGVAGGTVTEATKPLNDDPGFDRAATECVA
jgi:hypothetical protein